MGRPAGTTGSSEARTQDFSEDRHSEDRHRIRPAALTGRSPTPEAAL